MTDLDAFRKDPQTALFKELAKSHAVMLGLRGAMDRSWPQHVRPHTPVPHHMQPMSPQTGLEERTVWFFTKTSSDIARVLYAEKVADARLCLIGAHQDFHASINGTIVIERDPAIARRFWSTTVSAWYQDGIDDPELLVLRFDPEEAQVWASSGSAISFAWEIAKAHLTDSPPDLGETRRVMIRSASPRSHEAAE